MLTISYFVKVCRGEAVEEEAQAELVGHAAGRVLVVVLVHELVSVGTVKIDKEYSIQGVKFNNSSVRISPKEEEPEPDHIGMVQAL